MIDKLLKFGANSTVVPMFSDGEVGINEKGDRAMTALLRALYLWERAGLPKAERNTTDEQTPESPSRHRSRHTSSNSRTSAELRRSWGRRLDPSIRKDDKPMCCAQIIFNSHPCPEAGRYSTSLLTGGRAGVVVMED
jgi:hypothetical protein